MKKLLISFKKLKVDIICVQENLNREGTSEIALSLLKKMNIQLITDLKKSQIRDICLLSNASVITGTEQINETRIGKLNISTLKFDDNSYLLFESKEQFTSIILRGTSSVELDESERALHDSIRVLETIFKDPRFVPGGGACEMILIKELTSISQSLDSSTDTASFLSFIESLYEIPRVLIKNNEKDVAKILKELSIVHEKQDNQYYGVDMKNGIGDMVKQGVIEPIQSKLSQISMATQSCIQILKIDKNIQIK